MNLFLTIILCIIINLISRVVIKKFQELYSLYKVKKTLNDNSQFDINNLDFSKDFWSDLTNEDLFTDRNK